jgi:hypothetical protein
MASFTTGGDSDNCGKLPSRFRQRHSINTPTTRKIKVGLTSGGEAVAGGSNGWFVSLFPVQSSSRVGVAGRHDGRKQVQHDPQMNEM